MDIKSRQVLEYDKVLARLAGYTSFSASEALALAQVPATEFEEVRRLQVETSESRQLLDSRTDVSVGGARDVRRAVENAERGFVLQPADLLEIRATIAAGRELRRKLERLQESFPTLWQTAAHIEECPGLVSAISETLDERGEVLDSASAKLADIRRQLRVVHGRIQEKLRALLNSSQSQYLQEPIITSRGGRYVVPLIADHKGRIKGIVHDQSGSGATLWIEPLHTVELNNEFRALQLAEEEEIQRLLAELSGKVADQGQAIIRIVERLAELDLIFARARYANATAAVRPEFVPWRQRPRQEAAGEPFNPHPGSTLWIRGARHPLLDPDTVVPTDLLLDDDTFIVLITGPNTGGKTVSLKTTGLMVLMAQSGLHLPAQEARLTAFNAAFADIGDEQSIEQNLSTFSGHLRNIVRILADVDDRSLVLLDELGSGTDPAEGAALAQAVVSYLRDMGATTFVATHFPELKVYASQTPGATNASLLFDVETLMPTFEMSIGMPGRSNAFAIARRLGLPDTILDDAMRHIGASSHKAESLLDTIYEMRDKIAAEEAAARLLRRQLEHERAQLGERLAAIEDEREAQMAEARAVADAELEEVRAEIREMRRKLRDAESLNQLKKLQKQTVEVEAGLEEQFVLEPETLEDLPPAVPEPPVQARRRKAKGLQVGDTVLVVPIGARGQIVRLEKGEAEVAVGRLHMRTPLAALELKEAAAESAAESAPAARAAGPSPGMELDIRGQRVEEALAELDQYLDAAFLANLPWVRIIHGKGTGRLREAVREALQASDHVRSWEEGHDGEGGAGVTVARMALE